MFCLHTLAKHQDGVTVLLFTRDRHVDIIGSMELAKSVALSATYKSLISRAHNPEFKSLSEQIRVCSLNDADEWPAPDLSRDKMSAGRKANMAETFHDFPKFLGAYQDIFQTKPWPLLSTCIPVHFSPVILSFHVQAHNLSSCEPRVRPEVLTRLNLIKSSQPLSCV
jgi:hypothetical protein